MGSGGGAGFDLDVASSGALGTFARAFSLGWLALDALDFEVAVFLGGGRLASATSSSSSRVRFRRVDLVVLLRFDCASSADDDRSSLYFGAADAFWRVELRVPAMMRLRL